MRSSDSGFNNAISESKNVRYRSPRAIPSCTIDHSVVNGSFALSFMAAHRMFDSSQPENTSPRCYKEII